MSFVADVGQSRKTKMGECQENQLCVLTVWASGRLVLQSEDRFAKRSASRPLIFPKNNRDPTAPNAFSPVIEHLALRAGKMMARRATQLG
jgi:hypothetical protein